ncbi:MAG TPA: exonuclease domain-containing protein, partial [Chondromyces sp.]|nr:exonuclease domain-containing protein [Chondromyces sp.]
EVAPKLLTMLDGAFFVAHNVSFDLNFLQAELEEAGYNPFDGYTIDTVEMARIMFPTFDSYKLIDLTEKFGINHNRPHQADSDAYVTAELFLMMVEKLTSLPLVTLETLVELSKSLKSDLSILLEKIVSRKQQKIDRLPDEVEVFRGVALRKRETVKQERKKLIGEFPETMDQKESLLRKLPSYERRESQLKMMDYVYHSLIQNEHAVIEAGTGVGKSLGYLMPAVYYSKEVGEPIVISTYTIVLQQQLLHKEIRQLEKIVPFPVRAVVLKGKNHYIDLFKFVNSLKDSSDNYDFALAKMQILMWLLETETGDVDEINLSSGGWHFWNQVKQDGDYLNKERKSWLGRDFYLHAKKQAKEADVVITNHSLLVTDLKAESDVLPPYKHVIIDEAHHFEKAARDKLGKSLDSLSFKLLIGQLGTLHQKQLFFQCEEILQKYGETPNIQSIEIDREIASLMFEADEWFHTLQIYFEYHTKQKGGSSSRKQLRITELERGWKYWQEASLGAERLVADMNSMSGRLLKRLHLLEKHKEQMNVKEQVVLSDLYSFLADWREWIEQIEEVMFYTSEEHVVWMEGD